MIKLSLFITIFAGCFLCPSITFSQLKTYEFEQLDSLQKTKNKTVVVYIYTSWCKYCHVMKNITFKNKKIIEQLNDNFYFINFNAEDKRSIYFNGKTFTYKPTGVNTGVHHLAEELASINKKSAYPTLCFLNANNEIIFQFPEFISYKDLMIVLNQPK